MDTHSKGVQLTDLLSSYLINSRISPQASTSSIERAFDFHRQPRRIIAILLLTHDRGARLHAFDRLSEVSCKEGGTSVYRITLAPDRADWMRYYVIAIWR